MFSYRSRCEVPTVFSYMRVYMVLTHGMEGIVLYDMVQFYMVWQVLYGSCGPLYPSATLFQAQTSTALLSQTQKRQRLRSLRLNNLRYSAWNNQCVPFRHSGCWRAQGPSLQSGYHAEQARLRNVTKLKYQFVSHNCIMITEKHKTKVKTHVCSHTTRWFMSIMKRDTSFSFKKTWRVSNICVTLQL